MGRVGVVRGKLDLNRLIEEIINESNGEAGAVVLFIGFVKKKVDGKLVHRLDYDVYEPYATTKLNEIVEEESRRNGVLSIKAYHRVGSLKPGEPVVYIAVSSVKRVEAFDTARRVLERVKNEVPIFKLEVREDGEFWIIGDGLRVRRINEGK